MKQSLQFAKEYSKKFWAYAIKSSFLSQKLFWGYFLVCADIDQFNTIENETFLWGEALKDLPQILNAAVHKDLDQNISSEIPGSYLFNRNI